MTPRLTIVSCFRNAGELAARCIESVLAQTEKSWQHIIVDDASEDDSWLHVDRAMPHDDPRLWAFRRPARARKLANFLWAFPCMRGDIIVELDGDDWFARPDALSMIVAEYDRDSRVEATAGSHQGWPTGRIMSPVTQPARGFRIMQSGFADSVPAPRSWKRRLTEESLRTYPDIYYDPLTGRPWETNADLAMYAPALMHAEHIVGIDEALVHVAVDRGTHDWNEVDGKQREEGMRLFEILMAREWKANEHLLRPFRINQEGT